MKLHSLIFTLSLMITSAFGNSWQGYVDDQLVGTGNIKEAALIGLDGNVWATNALSLKAGEGRKIVSLFKNPTNVFATGLTVSGVKYLGVKADDRSIYAKKGSGGVVCVKTVQTVIIGTYDGGIQPGQAANTVERLADYLIENGY